MPTLKKSNSELMLRLEILKEQRGLINEIIDNDKVLYGKKEVLTTYNDALENINDEILDLMIIMKEEM
jgi:hypothetical protein